MRDVRVMLILGIWVALLPYLGFPIFWKNILLSLSGLILIFISYSFYRESKKANPESFENFSENTDFAEITNQDQSEYISNDTVNQ